MTVVVCVDDKGGMTFNNRRQSRDSLLLLDLFNTVESTVLISPFSKKLFAGESVRVEEDPLNAAEKNDICFIEIGSIREHIQKVSRLVIYRWNRLYPSDTWLDVEPTEFGFSLVSTYDFEGSSHEKITKEIYQR